MLKLFSALGADRVFDPERIQVLVGAFDEAWKSVQELLPQSYALASLVIVGGEFVQLRARIMLP